MTPSELAKKILEENPKLSRIPEAAAAAIIRAALRLVGDAVEATDEGLVRVPGLGVFRAKQVEREVEGKKQRMKVVVYRRPVPPQQAKSPAKSAKRS